MMRISLDMNKIQNLNARIITYLCYEILSGVC